MYCKICGNEEEEQSNYCSHDGAMLAVLPHQVQLVQGNLKYCRSCGGHNEARNIYCKECGKSLFVSKKRDYGRTSISAIPNTSINPPSMTIIKQGLLGGGIAILLMLIAGWIGSLLVSNNNPSGIWKSFLNNFGLPLSSGTGIAPTILGYNLTSLSINGYFTSFVSANFSISLKIAAFVTLFIPIFILGWVGHWITKKQKSITFSDKLAISSIVAITYGLFLFILSFIASGTLKLIDSQITILYPHFENLIRGLLFGFFFSLGGCLLASRRNSWLKSIPFGTSLYQGVVAPIKGIFVMFIIVLLFFLVAKPMNSFENSSQQMSKTEMSSIGVTIVPFIWEAAHFTPIEIKSPLLNTLDGKLGGYDTTTTVLSVSGLQGVKLNGTSIKELASTQTHNPDDLIVIDKINRSIHYMSFLVIIPSIFLFLAGGTIFQNNPRNKYLELAVFSGVYAIIMILINLLSSISINAYGQLSIFRGSNNLFLTVGSNSVFLFFVSFILAFVVSYAGMLYANRRASH